MNAPIEDSQAVQLAKIVIGRGGHTEAAKCFAQNVLDSEAARREAAATDSSKDKPSHEHTHKNEQGMLVKCYHKCRTSLSDFGFWLGMTIGFPLEHFLWHEVPGFSHIAHWLGL